MKLSPEKAMEMKKIEEEVNKHLEEEGLSSIKLVYGNGVYPKVKKIVRKRNTQRCVDQRGEKTFSAAIVVINSEIYIILERTIYICSHKLGILRPGEKLENSEFLEMGKTRKLGNLGKPENSEF